MLGTRVDPDVGCRSGQVDLFLDNLGRPRNMLDCTKIYCADVAMVICDRRGWSDSGLGSSSGLSGDQDFPADRSIWTVRSMELL